MVRWVITVIAVALAAGAGYLVGSRHWTGEARQVQQSERRAQMDDAEAATLRAENRDLQERIEQIAHEQERLAQENEALRKEQTKQQLLTGQGGNLPVLPPK